MYRYLCPDEEGTLRRQFIRDNRAPQDESARPAQLVRVNHFPLRHRSAPIPFCPIGRRGVEFGCNPRRSSTGWHMAVENDNSTCDRDVDLTLTIDPADERPIDLARLSDLMGTAVMCYDLRTGRVVARTDENLLPVVPPELMWQCVQTGSSGVLPLSS